MDNKICLILSTTDSREHAEMIADTLVFEHLAACVQIGAALRSTYYWEGNAQTESEYPLSIKTTFQNVEKLRKRFMQLHTYKCPQWICLQAEASQDYAKWVEESCSDKIKLD